MQGSLMKGVTDRTHLGLVLAALALTAFGTLMVWSATLGMTAHDAMFKRHLVGAARVFCPSWPCGSSTTRSSRPGPAR
jgi:cell division protein FtsW (lipid II flippase)